MPGLYAELAEYYDAVYSWKDYRKEAGRLMALARKYGRSGGREWLDVACGTGHHLEYIARRYRGTGVDSSAAMLRVARRRLPMVGFVRQDMRRLHLGQEYDVVSCLFSAIGYVRTLSGLRQATASMARHLKPGGVLLIEPWLTPQTYRAGTVHALVARAGEAYVARANSSERRGRLSVMRMHYLIAVPGRPIRHTVDPHVVGLFTVQETLRCLRGVGLRARFLRPRSRHDRGLYVAAKPRTP